MNFFTESSGGDRTRHTADSLQWKLPRCCYATEERLRLRGACIDAAQILAGAYQWCLRTLEHALREFGNCASVWDAEPLILETQSNFWLA